MGIFKGPDGTVYVPPAQEAQARADGLVPVGLEEAAQDTAQVNYGHGGLIGGLNAAATAGLSGLTLGASDVALRAISNQGQLKTIAADRADHPYISAGASVAGALLPAALSAGASSPAALAGRAGAGLTEGLGGGLLARAVGGAAEGAIIGAGQGASELALSSDPITLEHAAGLISSNMIFGAATGGGIGVAGGAVERLLSGSRRAIEERLAMRGASDAVEASPELASLDRKGLESARREEIERIRAERAPQRQQFTEELGEYRDRAYETDIYKASKHANESPDGDVREAGGALRSSDLKLRNVLDNKAGLADNPQRALGVLQTQEQALVKLNAWANAETSNLGQKLAGLSDEVRGEILAGKVPGYVPSALTPRGLDLAVEREAQLRFGSLTASAKHLNPITEMFPGAIERNRALQSRISDLIAEPASERLTQIEAARDALNAPHQKTVGEQLLHLIPGGNLVAAAASIGGRAVGGVRKAAGSAAAAAGRAASAFLGGAEKVAPMARMTAAQALQRVRFGTDLGRETQPAAAPQPDALPGLFLARSAGLRRQTMMAPDGSIQMRPDARMQITRALSPIAASDPIAADRMETTIARKVAFMSSKIPKRPEVGGIRVGPDNWHPSELQIRSWARTVRACEDPTGVEHRLAEGTITPEDAEAYRTCFPARFEALQRSLFAAVPTLPKTLSVKKKVALFTFTGVPTMPALQPNVLKVLQSTFAIEPGTQGGTAAPKPMPSFGALGSAKATDEATPAQKRGG